MSLTSYRAAPPCNKYNRNVLKQKTVSLRAASRLKKLRTKCGCVFGVKGYFQNIHFLFLVENRGLMLGSASASGTALAF